MTTTSREARRGFEAGGAARQRRSAAARSILGLALLLATALPMQVWAEGAVTQLNLERTIQLGLERNLGLKASQAGLEASTWGKRTSYLAYLPTGSISSSVTRVDDNSLSQANQARDGLVSLFEGLAQVPGFPDMGDIEFDPFLYRDTYRTNITLNQQFPLNPHLLGGSKLARAAERASRASFIAERDALVLELRRAYFQLLAARELRRVAEEGLASAENRNLLATEREELGLINRSERLRWEVALAESRSQLTSARTGGVLAEMSLNRLLDQDLRTALELEPADESVVAKGRELSELDPEILTQRVIAGSPSAAAIGAANQIAGASKTLAFSGLMPSLHFSFSYGWRENDTMDLDDYKTWNATAFLQVPLLDLGQGMTRYRQAAAEKRLSDYDTAGAIEGLRLAVYSAWHEVARTRENRVHRETAERQARATFDLMADRYQLGHISEFDLVEVQTALTAARAAAVKARYDYYIALSTLESLLGSGNRNSDR